MMIVRNTISGGKLSMTSSNKLKKAKNSYCSNALKQGIGRLKRVFFYDSTQRKHNKQYNDE